MSDDAFQGWRSVGRVAPTALGEARQALRDAVPRDSELSWDTGRGSLLVDGEPLSVHSLDGADEAAIAELARWLENAQCALGELARGNEGASELSGAGRTLELVTVISLDDAPGGRSGHREVRAGFRVGDETFPQPYFFMEPSPRPAPPGRPWLDAGGTWHDDSWFGAVLLGELLVEDDDPFFQLGSVRSFFQSAIAAAYGMLTSL